MTKLDNDSSPIRREMKVYGVEAPVNLEISAEGLSFSVKGTKKRVHLTWMDAVKAADTPQDVPAHFALRPYEFLQSQAQKKVKKAAEKV